MPEKQVHYRWYERIVRKIPRSSSREVHISLPNHIGEVCHWDDCRYSYSNDKQVSRPRYPEPPSRERFSKALDMYYNNNQDSLYSRRSTTRFVQGFFDPMHLNPPRSEPSHKRKSADELPPSPSRTKLFSRVTSDRYEDVCFYSPGAQDDGESYFEDYKRSRTSRHPLTPERIEAPEKQHYFSTYGSPCHYAQYTPSSSPRIRYQNHSYLEDDLLEDELVHPLPSSLVHDRYEREIALPIGRIDYIPVSESHLEETTIPALLMTGALHEDDTVLSEDPSPLFETSKALIDHLPINESLVPGVLGTIEAMVTTVVESLLPAEDTYAERHRASPQRVYARPARRTYDRDFIVHEEFHFVPQRPQSRYGCHYVDVEPRQPYARKPQSSQTSGRKSDDISGPNMKIQLEKYNQWWSDVQGKMSTTKPTLESIPFLSPETPLAARPGSFTSDWKWAAYKFFCLAFDLTPKSVPQPDYSNRFTFTTPPTTTSKQAHTNLLALRAQLKLEKVRWHEDKLRAVLGNGVARAERSKSVWSAVMELKKGVEEALENE